MAAFLWTLYDHHMLHSDEDADMDEERVSRLVERLEAHLDGVRVAGAEGKRIAEERYAEYPEAGELFLVRMMATEKPIPVAELDLQMVRAYLGANLPPV
jgi:hypothetical protein